MPRTARIVIPGIAHHVTQRSNRGEQVFFTDAHRQRYLELLAKYSAKYGLKIQAYCLMPNHVHLIAVPGEAESLSAALKPVHLRYAQEVNAYLGASGYLWGGRFYSCPLDGRHFWAAVRYVERNPVRARIVRKAERYRWSSAGGHCGLRADPLLSGEIEQADEIGDWSAWLGESDEPETLERVRLCTRTGRPAGEESFVRKLERTLGRRLAAMPVGRPRKKKQYKAKNG